jgi:hypothetical protein
MFRDSNDNNINIFKVDIKGSKGQGGSNNKDNNNKSKEEDYKNSIIGDREGANVKTNVYSISFKTAFYQI